MATANIKAIITAEDRASTKLKSVGASMTSLGNTMTKRLTLPIVAGFTAAVIASAKFEQQMSDVSTLISGDSTDAVTQLGDGILEMLDRVPKSADELGAAAYKIFSAGITDVNEALAVLEESAKLAVAGLGTTEEATDLMTSSLNAFSLQGLEAAEASDILFTAVKRGKTTVSELSQGFGSASSAMAGAKIEFDEFIAATSALTTVGLPATEAYTQLTAAVKALTKPTSEMKGLLKKMGFETGEAAVKSLGFIGTLQGLKKASKGNNEELIKAFGRIEGFKAALSLAGPTAKAFNDTLSDMRDETNNVNEAFEKQKKTATAQWQLLKNKFSKILIKIGNDILPTVISVVQDLTKWLEKGLRWWNKLTDGQKKFIIKAIAVVASIGLVLRIIGGLIGTLAKLRKAFLITRGAMFLFGTKMKALVGIATFTKGGLLKFAAFIKSPLFLNPWTAFIAVAVGAFILIQNKAKETMGVLADTEAAVEATGNAQSDAIRRIQQNPNLSSKRKGELIRGIAAPGTTPDHQQYGGNVQAGRPVMVGEAGREVFVPNRSGRIVPNHKLGGGSTVNFNVNIGMFAGTPMERRKIAKTLFRDFQDASKQLGITPTDLLNRKAIIR